MWSGVEFIVLDCEGLVLRDWEVDELIQLGYIRDAHELNGKPRKEILSNLHFCTGE
jgi:hypothetical protein